MRTRARTLAVWCGMSVVGVVGSPRAADAEGRFAPWFNLSSLDVTTGFEIDGTVIKEESGYAVASAGDVNADGYPDVILGAPSPSLSSGVGVCYVVFGGPGRGAGGSFDLSTLDGTNGFRITGTSPSDGVGDQVAGAGDFNDDGIDDLLVSAFRVDAAGRVRAGKTYLVFGRDGAGGGFPATLDLATFSSTDGIVFYGMNVIDQSGRSLACAGDVNADGVDDIIIGAPDSSNNSHGIYTGAGAVFVVFGGANVGVGGTFDLATLNGANGFAMGGINDGDHAGKSVAGAGDLNNDGIDDIIVGAPSHDSGESYVVFGRNPPLDGQFPDFFILSALSGSDGFVIQGVGPDDDAGMSVAGAGDLNDDGVDDVIIGASGAGPIGAPYTGAAYVVFGASGIGSSGVLPLSTLDGSNGFVVNCSHDGATFGWDVASAGDINADGVNDVVIGAYFDDPNGAEDAGAAYVLLGGVGVGGGGALDTSCLSGANGFVINGADPGSFTGYAVGPAGDLDGDGTDDLLLGARRASPSSINRAGKTYLFLGQSAPLAKACEGDLDADGDSDIFDFALFIEAYPSTESDCEFNTGADLDQNDEVDLLDFGLFASNFGCGS